MQLHILCEETTEDEQNVITYYDNGLVLQFLQHTNHRIIKRRYQSEEERSLPVSTRFSKREEAVSEIKTQIATLLHHMYIRPEIRNYLNKTRFSLRSKQKGFLVIADVSHRDMMSTMFTIYTYWDLRTDPSFQYMHNVDIYDLHEENGTLHIQKADFQIDPMTKRLRERERKKAERKEAYGKKIGTYSPRKANLTLRAKRERGYNKKQNRT